MVIVVWVFFNSHKHTPVNHAYNSSSLIHATRPSTGFVSTTEWRGIWTNFKPISCTSTPFLLPDSDSQDINHCSLHEYSTSYNGWLIMGWGELEVTQCTVHVAQFVFSSWSICYIQNAMWIFIAEYAEMVYEYSFHDGNAVYVIAKYQQHFQNCRIPTQRVFTQVFQTLWDTGTLPGFAF
jgi:hypothetical protein